MSREELHGVIDSPCLHTHTQKRERFRNRNVHYTSSKGHVLDMESYHSIRKSLDPHQRLQKHGPRINLSFFKTNKLLWEMSKEGVDLLICELQVSVLVAS